MFKYLKDIFCPKDYVSPLDLFLKQFDRDHSTLSNSQAIERKKYKEIYYKRDNKVMKSFKKILWDKF